MADGKPRHPVCEAAGRVLPVPEYQRPADRPGELVGRQPRGPRLGYQGPDQGYALALAARVFPTFCESIVDRRDPILAARMVPYLDAGAAVAFVGVIHCPGVIARLRDEGFTVTPLAGQ